MHANNWRITNCDLWSTFNVLSSATYNPKIQPVCTSFPNNCLGTTYGYVADNILRNGGASHYMYLWRQVIFERNIASGISVTSMGQCVGATAHGGFDHHILHADNIVELVLRLFLVCFYSCARKFIFKR